MSESTLDAVKVRQATEGLQLIGQNAPVEYYDRIGSTNDRVQELPAGALVVAAAQEAGRGRRERTWASPPGGLYFSLQLRPEEKMLRRLPATLLGGLAVAEALDETAQVEAQLKWPNDVFLDGRKVAGILGELTRDSSGHRLVLGIGINVATPPEAFPDELKETATSVAAVTGQAPPLDQVLRAVLERFEAHYLAVQRGGGAYILSMACARMPLLGKPVQVKLIDRELKGTASGLNATGGLVVELASGERHVVVAGEVEEVRPE